MNPVDFPQKNIVLGPPANMTEEECMTISAHNTGERFITVWEPTIEDLERLAKGGKIYLSVHSRPSMPPVWVGTEDPFVDPAGPEQQWYYIWSRKNTKGDTRAFWRPDGRGYTDDLYQAGKYTMDQCIEMKITILTEEVKAQPMDQDSYAVGEKDTEQLLGRKLSCIRN